MDTVTRTIIELMDSTDVTNRQDLIDVAQLAFLDYIASLGAAEHYPTVKALAGFVSASSPFYAVDAGLINKVGIYAKHTAVHISRTDKALYYGFASHYLDFDDAQANLAGHFSTVLYSALLAVLEPTDTWMDFFRAYIIGAELEGIIGSIINPSHRTQGWHSTGTVGVIGAAAAVGVLRGVHGESLASLLSLAATQSCGMSFQSGSDGKPLHAGLAARNAVWTYELVTQTSLQGSLRPFNSETGWFHIIADVAVTAEAFTTQWLQPGQILEPGLWMKLHPYCSAAICGAEGAEILAHRLHTSIKHGHDLTDDASMDTKDWASQNLWPFIESVTVHFPSGADKALKYTLPTTGREGQFSIEFVVWQILQYGSVQDDLFFAPTVPIEATQYMSRIARIYDLEPVSQAQRITKLTIHMTDGGIHEMVVTNPKGSPLQPLTLQDISKKLALSIDAARVESVVETFRNETIYTFINTLKGEGVLHV